MENGQKINIIYEDNHLLVVDKPINTPTQQDSSNDLDMLTLLKQDLKIRYNKPGDVYLGLVHRLDRPVSGVMVFAKTSKAASRLSEEVRKQEIHKEYHAVVLNNPKQEDTLIDYLKKDTKTNMVTVSTNKDNKAKYAELCYNVVSSKENLSLVCIKLKTGRSHQIRVQFASRNHPLWGDQRYNKSATVKQQIALHATKLTFIHPTTKEVLTFTSKLPNRYPFTLFEED